jgi:hypothetical protein
MTIELSYHIRSFAVLNDGVLISYHSHLFQIKALIFESCAKMPSKGEFQFVWPKDRIGKRGFLGGFWDIARGKGPDMFIQKEGSSRPIKADQWGNW